MQDSEHILFIRIKIKRDQIISECQSALKCSLYYQRETAREGANKSGIWPLLTPHHSI